MNELLDVGLWQLGQRAEGGDLAAAAVVSEIERFRVDSFRKSIMLQEANEVIESLRHAVEQLQRSEDRAHGLDTESSLYVDALQYTQGGRNEVLR